MQPEPLFYTAKEVAGIVRLSCKAVYAWLEAGGCPGAVKLGRQWRVPAASLQALGVPPTATEKKECSTSF